MRADQQVMNQSPESPIRPVAHRCPAHRWRQDGTLQLAGGPRDGRFAGAADRRHRPRALDAGERRADPRGAALAGARLGRGPCQPGRASRSPPRAHRRAARVGPRLPRPRDLRAGAGLQAGQRQRRLSRRARGPAGRRNPPPGSRRGRDRGRGSDPRAGSLSEPAHRRSRDRPGRRDPALQLRRRGRRRRHADQRRDPGRRSPLEHPQADARARGARSRAAPLCAPAAAPRPRRQEALQAPRCRLGAGAS